MRKSFLTSKLRLVSLLLLCSAATLHGQVVWQNNFTPDATDENVILGEPLITLQGPGPVHITALSADVLVTMTTGDVIIQGQPSGDSRLYLNATGGRTITFVMTNNLTFRGSAGGAIPDLLVVVQGAGQVIFQLDGGKTLTLTQNGSSGVTQMLVQMNALPSTLYIERSAVDPNSNVEVIVEGGSILSYLADVAQPNSTEAGTISWDTTNIAGSGRMILTIGQLGAVIVRGRLLTAGGDFTLADIDPSVPAGGDAVFNVINGSPTTSGSLLVQNYNETLGEFIWDPWDNLQVRQAPPFGNFSGVQWGFIIGSYGSLDIGTDSYFDYVSLTGTLCPTPPIACASSKVKARNPSALFTDGQPDPNFVAPLIVIDPVAGMFFRSGIDNEGNIQPLGSPNPYTIDPTKCAPGAGFPVFDIEGPLNIVGFNSPLVQESQFQLLSLEVNPTGGPLFEGGSETIFPLRTFTKLSEQVPCTDQTKTVYLSYNKACFLNNGRVNLYNVSFEHTDENHCVFEDNDVTSQPAYIGGETWLLNLCMAKPKWAFINSRFNIHTSVALTGVDLLVPNGTGPAGSACYDNQSMFVFYENGYAIDHGNGRQMILGTFVGSTACDGCTVISKDAQLDVMQTTTCAGGALQSLILSTTQNDNTIVEGIPVGVNLTNQYSIQTIYLGNSSNISVGTDGSQGTSMEVTVTQQYTFPLTTFPELLINGNFFSFETRGGCNNLPSTSNVTGQGGIFVDMNGTFSIGSDVCGYTANMGAMVTQSRNGLVDLPKNRVFFDPRIGIANWNIDLSDPSQRVVVPNGRFLSEYNLNWMFVTKDYNIFSPYLVNCYDACEAPLVTTMNVSGIPIVEGFVQQFNIQGSRIGDPAHLEVNGGYIGELVMLVGYNSAEAPVAVLVLENSAVVGLGSAHRNVDSLYASVQLGVNGINLILNGADATININEDVIVNNICAFLPGPDITPDAVLRITSKEDHTLRITKDGVLDLSAFASGQTIEFAGNLRVIFEPGATVLFGNDIGEGPVLRFAENARCEFHPGVVRNLGVRAQNIQVKGPNDPSNIDALRVTFAGIGVLEFAECSRADLPRDAFVGIQGACTLPGAFVTLRITDDAQFHIGDADCDIPGGVLQVGNTVDAFAPLITFSLVLDGPNATFEVGPQGFLGLGVGIVSKPPLGHDFWTVAPLANVQKISLDLQNGLFRHSQLYAGSDDRSALIALCDSVNGNSLAAFDFYMDPIPGPVPYFGPLLSNTTILGGGDLIATSTSAPAFNPVVDITNGFIDLNYSAGILASSPMIQETTFQDVDAFAAQLLLRVQNILAIAPTPNRGVAASSSLRNQVRVGYVDNGGLLSDGLIARTEVRDIIGKTPQTTVQEHSLEIGAVQLNLVPVGTPGVSLPRPITSVIEIGN